MALMTAIIPVKRPVLSTVFLPGAVHAEDGQNTGMIADVLARIEKRLKALDISAAKASLDAGLSEDAIRNLRRAAKGELSRSGASSRTINALAPVLQTTAGWLLDGIGVEDIKEDQSRVPVMGYVGAGARVEPAIEQTPEDGLDSIELPFPIPEPMIAFIVRGESMMPVYNDGDAVIVYREQARPLEVYFGEEAVVRTSTGERYLKTILRGAGKRVNLSSFNAKVIEDVMLDWVGEIYVTIRSGQLRRMEARERAVARRRMTIRGRETEGMEELPLSDEAQ